MNSLAKERKNFKLNDTKNQIKLILKTLVDLNQNKTSPDIKYITVSKVKFLIAKMIKRYKRLMKVYWAIDIKNKNYKQSGGVEEYSARDIYNMVIQILKKDGYGKVCKRTIERDIKLLNEMGLLKSKIIRFGECRGSKSHYKQNMQLAHLHKTIIFEYLKHLLIESLNDKKIIGDFDDSLDDENFNYTNLEKFGILSKVNDKSIMSHVCEPDVFNKNNISYINNKNSIENFKEVLSEKIVTSTTQKIRKCKFERQDVQTRLISIQKVSKAYLKQIKERSNNDATYINALINLETAIIDYKNEYKVEDILEHFLKQFASRYKNKIWMMMKRRDGVISDYETIWEGRFRDWYPNKYKSELLPITNEVCYGKHIRIRNRDNPCFTKKSVVQQNVSSPFSACHLQSEKDKFKKDEIEREEREREKRRLELKRREEYLKELFEREAQEMQERLRKAREEKERLKEQIRQTVLSNSSNPEKSSEVIIGNTVSLSNSIGTNSSLDMNSNNHFLDNQSVFEGFCKQKGRPPATFPGISLKVNYEGFKTTKGMKISLASLGINVSSEQEKNTIKEEGEII